MPVTDERQLPGEVERILQAAVHPVALERRADVCRVPREQDATRSEVRRHLRVTVESCRVRDGVEADRRVIAADGRCRVDHEVGVRGARPQVDTPAPVRKRGQDHGNLVQVAVDRLVRLRPAGQGDVEYRPRLRDIVARQCDAAQLAGGAMEAVAPDYPVGRDLLRPTVTCDRRGEVALIGPQVDETGRAHDLAALPVEVVGQNLLGHLFRDADVEPVPAAAARQVDLAEHTSPGVEPCYPLLDAGRQERLEEAERLEDLERARMHDRRSVPVERAGMSVDEATRDVAAVELRREEQPGRACANHENGLTGSHVAPTLAARLGEASVGALQQCRRPNGPGGTRIEGPSPSIRSRVGRQATESL